MTEQELKEIEERANKATPGPWRVDESLPNVYIRHDGIGWPIASMFHTANGPWKENAEFIAHARTDIPALLADNERLRAELDAAKDYRTPKVAIPHKAKEPTKVGNITFCKGTTIWSCPTCGMPTTRSHKYCGSCGQALRFD